LDCHARTIETLEARYETEDNKSEYQTLCNSYELEARKVPKRIWEPVIDSSSDDDDEIDGDRVGSGDDSDDEDYNPDVDIDDEFKCTTAVDNSDRPTVTEEPEDASLQERIATVRLLMTEMKTERKAQSVLAAIAARGEKRKADEAAAAASAAAAAPSSSDVPTTNPWVKSAAAKAREYRKKKQEAKRAERDEAKAMRDEAKAARDADKSERVFAKELKKVEHDLKRTEKLKALMARLGVSKKQSDDDVRTETDLDLRLSMSDNDSGSTTDDMEFNDQKTTVSISRGDDVAMTVRSSSSSAAMASAVASAVASVVMEPSLKKRRVEIVIVSDSD